MENIVEQTNDFVKDDNAHHIPFMQLENEIIDSMAFDKPIDKILYITLRRFGNRVFPSYSRLEAMVGASENTLRTSMKRLEKMGLVTVKQRRKKGSDELDSNLYILHKVPEYIKNDSAMEENKFNEFKRNKRKKSQKKSEDSVGNSKIEVRDSEGGSKIEVRDLDEKVDQNLRDVDQNLRYVDQNLRGKNTRTKNTRINNINNKTENNNDSFIFQEPLIAVEPLETVKTKDEINEEIIVEVIAYLNEKADKNYKASSKGHRKNILQLIDPSDKKMPRYEKEDLLKVIDIKCEDDFFIKNDYLTPQTLFRTNNFDRYLNEKPGSKKEMVEIEEKRAVSSNQNRGTYYRQQGNVKEEMVPKWMKDEEKRTGQDHTQEELEKAKREASEMKALLKKKTEERKKKNYV